MKIFALYSEENTRWEIVWALFLDFLLCVTAPINYVLFHYTHFVYTWKKYIYIPFLKSGNANNVSIKKMFINSQRSIIFNSFSRFDSYEVKVYLLSIYIQKKKTDQSKSDLWFRRKKKCDALLVIMVPNNYYWIISAAV